MKIKMSTYMFTKKPIILVILILLYATTVSGQQYSLVLNNKTTHKENRILLDKKQREKIRTKQGLIFAGNLRMKNDTDLVLISGPRSEEDTTNIFMSDVSSIKVQSVSTRVCGSVIMTAGGVLSIIGVSVISNGNKENDLNGLFEMAGGLALCMIGEVLIDAGIIFLTIGKTYYTDNCDLSIAKNK